MGPRDVTNKTQGTFIFLASDKLGDARVQIQISDLLAIRLYRSVIFFSFLFHPRDCYKLSL